MSNSSSYILQETGKSYSLVSGSDAHGTLSVESGTVVSGATIEPEIKTVHPIYPPGPAYYEGIPGQEIISSGAGSIDTTVTGASYIEADVMVTNERYAVAPSTQIINSGGFASNTLLGPYGSSVIEDGGVAYNVTIAGGQLRSGSALDLQNGYAVYSAAQIVSSGGELHGATVGQTVFPAATGILQIEGGSADHVTVLPNGSIAFDGGTLSDVHLSGGSLSVGAGQTVHNVVSDGGTIILGKDAQLTGMFSTTGQTTVELDGVGVDPSVFSAAFVQSSPNYTGRVLEVQSGGTVVNTLPVASDFTAPFYFQAVPSGRGVDLVIGTPCYCRGTLIATPDGERPVEDLQIGDKVLTASGESRPVRWVGRRAYDRVFAFGNRDILPVCFKAGSLGDDLPRRDLMVSPLHAMFIEGHLIPALHLVNDISIVQVTNPVEICYVHIELDSHDILLAEGAPSESFVDDGSRLRTH